MRPCHKILLVRLPVAVFAACMVISALPGGAAAELSLLGVRYGEYPEKTRVVLDLSGPTSFHAFALAKPHRVVVDVEPMLARVVTSRRAKGGLVLGYRFGKFSASTSRIVLDVAGPVLIEQSFLLLPDSRFGHRLVIDLKAIPANVAALAPPKSVVPAAPTTQRPIPRPHPGRQTPRMIAIDPGHGGADPGAIGVNGVYEKDITLRFARDLKRALERLRGFRVILTRRSDIYVRLRDRIAIAREANADLFVSIHADSLSDRNIRGASVYTLSETASDKEAAALAAKENRSDIIAGVDLTKQNDEVMSILIDLTQRETMNRSASYANMLLGHLRKSARVLRKSHRFAGFAVLKAPDIPSVLVELGYLSNPKDVQYLTSTSGRQSLIKAILRGTQDYFRATSALN